MRYIPGDVMKTGIVNSNCIHTCLHHFLSDEPLDPYQLKVTDLDKDGILSLKDIANLSQYINWSKTIFYTHNNNLFIDTDLLMGDDIYAFYFKCNKAISFLWSSELSNSVINDNVALCEIPMQITNKHIFIGFFLNDNIDIIDFQIINSKGDEYHINTHTYSLLK